MRATINPVSNELTPRLKHLPLKSSKKLSPTRGFITFLLAFLKILIVRLRVDKKRKFKIHRNSKALFSLRPPTSRRGTTAMLLNPIRRISLSRNGLILLRKVKMYH